MCSCRNVVFFRSRMYSGFTKRDRLVTMNFHVPSKITGSVGLLLAATTLVLASPNTGSGDTSDPQLKLKNQVISLVEDKLSKALTFKRQGEVPDFSTLDEIHPSWDNGDPGKARRTWVDRKYYYHLVQYRVDSVFLTSLYTARVRGKKRVRYGHDVDFMVMFDREEKIDQSSHFVMSLYRDAKGEWYVRAETEF